ncbi:MULTISPECIES: TetR/AcrR family transcriptional regulator [unclassified Ruegeria]|uniref:TetR/AcrR family transcriptional regulator n=1 Tax=unclassified Ruegeria TaxID=2625375 RepID=UPI0014885A8E|nr:MULTISPECIES: TetR/AcrR family transcriptional regulator [unclassified Ruegeria]NOD64827.1 TetR family transcriptional regulator [Ruegeria sp. HKCCD6109]
MNKVEPINKLADRKTHKVRKRDAKKREIAESAINALKIYGYARTTLRDIAAHSDMSLGSLHYYFEDKDELLVFCVRQYKLHFVELMTSAVEGIEAPDKAMKAFCHALAETIQQEAELHRLWYDIRNQAMFDDTFEPVVTEIEELLIGMMAPLAVERTEQERLYMRLDGAFRFLLQGYLKGSRPSVKDMRSTFVSVAAGSVF